MRTLVIGGAASGKSEFAENLILQAPYPTRYYIATMEPYGREGQARIRRHHALRAGKGFVTLECYRDLAALRLPKGGSVLLECMTNLVASELFGPDGIREGVQQRVLQSVRALEAQTDEIVVVTGDLFCDGVAYENGTDAYLRHLGRVNAALAARFDAVVEVVCGCAVAVKGDLP